MSIDQRQAPLWQALCASAESPQAAFHTPGHKKGRGLSASVLAQLGAAFGQMDLPELPELDNLFAPESVIQEAQALAAVLFGAEHTWFLTNGSTAGILAAILATCGPGDQIIMPRNVHQSVISGLILSGATPIFVQPPVDRDLNLVHCLTPEQVQQALVQFPQTKAVLLVYPTYEGICGNVAAIATLAHNHGIPLLVDEAHSPHFAFHPELPQPALAAGADLAVQSTHKMLGAVTQAAMLHVQGNRIEPYRISQALQLVQSTSPNYLLLASLDAARQQMALYGKPLMEQVLRLADRARTQLQALPHYPIANPIETAPGCITLDRTRLTLPTYLFGGQGYWLDQTLIATYGVTAELVTPDHLTFLIGLGNTDADIDQLLLACRALYQPTSRSSSLNTPPKIEERPGISRPALSPRDAYWSASEVVALPEAVDRISAESICPYPPGIPLLLPGERIRSQDLVQLLHLKESGGVVTGCHDLSLKTLKVVRK
ncbi:aminotransferase class I/II-fold pyridoxal phosphate-dependent enzyme [Acaryochloris sp. IP29b_bin.148]|uniref:aminotransferase class I/II-fold pyridoxal phosphate-dependent enzyme n=1 Tax=Acaryochloris sp. IP29b_bin.148 TaxID=2969218 RepID=UPI0026050D40|nr:aminotransferase class I/II-fold pyridoxal phosphate-dependent enzyme [Acaryochloris sp. IP29b_bin.148]